MLLTWSSSQGLNALMNSAEFIAGFADKGSGEVDLTLAKGTGSATFTRATTATTVNSAGLIVSVASGTPRSYYDPTTLAYRGYLAEGARTNLCLQSNEFETTPWVSTATNVKDVVGPDGSTSAWTCPGNGTQSILQDIILTAANYTATFFVKKTTGVSGSFPVIRAFASPFTSLCTVDTNNGIATAWTALTGGWTIQTTTASVVSFGDYWRVSLTFLATAATWTVGFYPAGATSATQSSGSLGGGTLSAVFYGGQVELGAFASSYIPTTTASVPRNADVLTYPSAGNVSASVGTCYAEIMTLYTVAGGFRDFVSAAAGTSASILGIGSGAASTTVYTTDSTTVTTKSSLSDMSTASRKRASSWGGSTFGVTGDGLAPATNSFDGGMSVAASIGIGCNGAGTGQESAIIRNVRIYQTQLSAAQLQAVTA